MKAHASRRGLFQTIRRRKNFSRDNLDRRSARITSSRAIPPNKLIAAPTRTLAGQKRNRLGRWIEQGSLDIPHTRDATVNGSIPLRNASFLHRLEFVPLERIMIPLDVGIQMDRLNGGKYL